MAGRNGRERASTARDEYGLTELQRRFVDFYVTGMTAIAAAAAAGISDPHANGGRTARLPHVAAEIRRRQQLSLRHDLTHVALNTLRRVLLDPLALDAAKVQAARLVLHAAGHLSAEAYGDDRAGERDDRKLARMSAGDLERILDADRARLAELRRLLADHVAPAIARDVTPPAIAGDA